MDANLELQRRRNTGSRDSWDLFAGHRARVTRLAQRALQGRPAPRRLCVLGAGNCNDLDLKAVLRAANAVDLVDLDGDALAAALNRQGLTSADPVRAHGALDLADGALPRDCLVLTPGAFDCVLSSCLLTQLNAPVIEVYGEDAAGLGAALGDLRRRHLAQMLDLLRPGGTALLVSDLVASDSLPGLAETPAAGLKDLMTRLVEEKNFFSGANPFAVLRDARDDPVLAARLDTAALVAPWIWRFSPERSYLVYAIALRCRG